ncbi:transposase family protein [Bacillus andreraoultii]|uniref:transposase family protein n=1 Tax=Bacillus andreraoultii TaxID=1499685 RepID=UPI000A5B4197|nr:transposase family protein [Bacillus andreraoultii]
MVTRKERREREKNVNYFFEFLKIQKRFFKDLVDHLKNIVDHRHQSYITYGPGVILFTMILKNMTGLKSMRTMSNRFNKEECIKNVEKVLG